MRDGSPPSLQVEHVTKSYGKASVVSDVSFSLGHGEFVSLLGQSGCGKTTTLSMIAGFEQPDSGRIVVRGRPVGRSPPERRGIGMVFQSYALFPHLTVSQNIGFGLKMRRLGQAEISERASRMAKLVKVEHLLDHHPRALSGGQQQRVSLARALVLQPAIMLLDEPFGALDRQLREELQIEVRALLRRLQVTTLFVTHDQDEALSMSDRVAVMHAGRIEQIADPRRLYDAPATLNVAAFIGKGTIMSGIVQDQGRSVLSAMEALDVPPGLAPRLVVGEEAAVFLRPEHVRLVANAQSPFFRTNGRVVAVAFHGDRQYATATVPGDRQVLLIVERHFKLGLGQDLCLGWKSSDALVFQRGKHVSSAEPT